MNDMRVIKRLLAIENLLEAMNPKGAKDLIEENKKLQAEILELKKERGLLKSEVTKLKNKMKEVK